MKRREDNLPAPIAADGRLAIIREAAAIPLLTTAHGSGQKRVLLATSETSSTVTQIALTTFDPGEIVEIHTHPTMDEHYYILEGEADFTIGDDVRRLGNGTYILIPAGMPHSLTSITPLKLITLGIAYD